MPISKKRVSAKPIRTITRLNVWNCNDLRRLIKKKIDVHVKDANVAKRLEEALAVEVAYNDGGGDPVAIC